VGGPVSRHPLANAFHYESGGEGKRREEVGDEIGRRRGGRRKEEFAGQKRGRRAGRVKGGSEGWAALAE
jgi:hypothetical protein